ncbi:MAG TPA: flippase [Longimicrobium sp.]|nr:flippase [Longimicrobium sp.]
MADAAAPSRPASVWARGAARLGVPLFGSVARNAGWLMAERVTTMAVGLGTTVWMARYLGPAQFGLLSYALSLVALFGFLTYLGLDGIVTRELVRTPEQRDEILGTTLALRFGGAVTVAVGIFLFVLLRGGNQGSSSWLMAVIAGGAVFDTLDAVDLWFQSRTRSRVSVVVRSVAFFTGAAVKVGLIVAGAPLLAFAVAQAGQQALKAAGFAVVYRRDSGRLSRLRFSGARAKEMLRQSWPLILSSAGALVYLKIDQVMLAEMRGPAEVGVYSVAARVSEVWYFIPLTIATSVFPGLVRSRETDAEGYRRRLQHAYNVVVWLALGVAIVVTLLARPVVDLLYGDEYRGAAGVLAIHVWTCPAIFMGAILSRWLVAEGLLIFSLTRHGLGAVVNVALNFVLIPRYGGQGAAMATLVSYTISAWLACYTDRRTLPAARMMTHALTSPVRQIPVLLRAGAGRLFAGGGRP